MFESFPRVCLFSISKKQFPTPRGSPLIKFTDNHWKTLLFFHLPTVVWTSNSFFEERDYLISYTVCYLAKYIQFFQITHLVILTCIHPREPTADRLLCDKRCAICFICSEQFMRIPETQYTKWGARGNLPREVSSEWRCVPWWALVLLLITCFILWEPTFWVQLTYTIFHPLTKDFNCTITFNPLNYLMKYVSLSSQSIRRIQFWEDK